LTDARVRAFKYMEDVERVKDDDDKEVYVSQQGSSELEEEYLRDNDIHDDNLLSSLPDEAKDDYMHSSTRYWL
jgi:hypothetical protein